MKVLNYNTPHSLEKVINRHGTISSKDIPVQVFAETYNMDGSKLTHYIVKDGRIPIGHVNLIDTPNGVNVSFIRNYNPNMYSGFGWIADQIEVEHCLKRGLKDFEITSEASLNSHALHFIRGKRFGEITDPQKKEKLLKLFNTADINKIVEMIIKTTPKGSEYNTKFLERIPMFMPQSLIKKYIEIIKKHPLLK